MPFKSKKQKKFMLAAAHNPEFADKVGIEQEVAKKFVKDSEDKPEHSKYFGRLKKKLKK